MEVEWLFALYSLTSFFVGMVFQEMKQRSSLTWLHKFVQKVTSRLFYGRNFAITFIAETGATFWACGRTEGAISSPSTTWPPYLICQVCVDQHHCCYANIVLQLQFMLMLCSQVISSHKGWRSKGRRFGQLIWASESTLPPWAFAWFPGEAIRLRKKALSLIPSKSFS